MTADPIIVVELKRHITTLESENAALRAEVEALRADAERYRYLKSRDFCITENVTQLNADELIDAARKEEK